VRRHERFWLPSESATVPLTSLNPSDRFVSSFAVSTERTESLQPPPGIQNVAIAAVVGWRVVEAAVLTPSRIEIGDHFGGEVVERHIEHFATDNRDHLERKHWIAVPLVGACVVEGRPPAGDRLAQFARVSFQPEQRLDLLVLESLQFTFQLLEAERMIRPHELGRSIRVGRPAAEYVVAANRSISRRQMGAGPIAPTVAAVRLTKAFEVTGHALRQFRSRNHARTTGQNSRQSHRRQLEHITTPKRGHDTIPNSRQSLIR